MVPQRAKVVFMLCKWLHCSSDLADCSWALGRADADRHLIVSEWTLFVCVPRTLFSVMLRRCRCCYRCCLIGIPRGYRWWWWWWWQIFDSDVNEVQTSGEKERNNSSGGCRARLGHQRVQFWNGEPCRTEDPNKQGPLSIEMLIEALLDKHLAPLCSLRRCCCWWTLFVEVCSTFFKTVLCCGQNYSLYYTRHTRSFFQ